ncbi:unnamed protein product [Ranitomeya imitator]|uniref:Uncharacterized protein n=1 Tax=Ranitomeya imitator TaxID=111125 RepID=A0ABN9MTC1_9NEOB|nr:unnamed protein product [Ranitomeya imitator]
MTPINLKDLGLKIRSNSSPQKNNPPVQTFIALIEREVSNYHKCIIRGDLTFRPNLKKAEHMALKTLMSDKDIVIKSADKGGAIVIMDYSIYRSEILSQLANREVYLPLENNPTSSIRNKIGLKVKGELSSHNIEKKTGEFLTNEHPIIPVFNVLPKIHKNLEKPPGRLIVASTDSILSRLSILLEKVLTPLVKNTPAFLLDTGAFLQIIRNLGKVPEGTLLVTLDGIRATEQLLRKSQKDPRVISFLLDLLRLVLTENFFIFGDTFYVQVQGSAMGSNVAPPYEKLFHVELHTPAHQSRLDAAESSPIDSPVFPELPSLGVLNTQLSLPPVQQGNYLQQTKGRVGFSETRLSQKSSRVQSADYLEKSGIDRNMKPNASQWGSIVGMLYYQLLNESLKIEAKERQTGEHLGAADTVSRTETQLVGLMQCYITNYLTRISKLKLRKGNLENTLERQTTFLEPKPNL